MITQAILDQARASFVDLRECLYSLPESLAQSYSIIAKQTVGIAFNCYAKAMLLKAKLESLGFIVEEMVIEFSWAEMGLPQWIIDLWPSEYPVTHIYLRAFDGKIWRILDPSWDSRLAKACNYYLGKWDELEKPGLTAIGKPYTEEQRLAMFNLFNQPGYKEEYFRKVEPFMRAANAWFAEQRAKLN